MNDNIIYNIITIKINAHPTIHFRGWGVEPLIPPIYATDPILIFSES